MYAIIDYLGKQHKVTPGEIVHVDKLEKEAGDAIEFDKVLYVSGDKGVKVGGPYVAKAKVVGEVLGDMRDKKLIAFMYRPKKGSSRKVGHRQTYTRVKITNIVG